MKLIEVPQYNDDGSVRATMLIGPEEAKGLLQFAINVLAAAGSANFQAVINQNKEKKEFND